MKINLSYRQKVIRDLLIAMGTSGTAVFIGIHLSDLV